MQNTLTTSAVTVGGETVAVTRKSRSVRRAEKTVLKLAKKIRRKAKRAIKMSIRQRVWIRKVKKEYKLMLQYLGEDRVPEERLDS